MSATDGMERCSKSVTAEVAEGECVLGKSTLWTSELIEGLHPADVGIDYPPETGIDQGNQSRKICADEVIRSCEVPIDLNM